MARRKLSHKQPQNKVFWGMKSRYLVVTFKTLVVLAVVVGLGGLGWWLFQGDYFRISSVSCQEAKYGCSAETEALFANAVGKNIFLYKPRQLTEAALRQQPALAKVEIKKQLPNKLKVKVYTREPFALLVNLQGDVRVVDKQGVVLPVDPNKFNGPKLKVASSPVLGEAVADPQTLQGLKLIELLKLSYIPFKQVWFPDEVSLTTKLTNEVVATFSAQKALSPQVDSLQYILHHSRMENKAISGIDLRFQKPIITFSQPGRKEAAKL